MHNIEKTSNVIRSLSGLVDYQDLVLGVSDEYHGLFVRGSGVDQFYNFSGYPASITYKDQKKVKPDQESISLVSLDRKDYVIAFPSLSKLNRDELGVFYISAENAQFQIHSHKRFKLEKLFKQLQGREINIEGHVLFGNDLLLLNRGNETSSSELITVSNGASWIKNALAKDSDSDFDYSFSKATVDLGRFDGHSIHWTDGMRETGQTMLFLATVEKTDNAYDDGVVLASFMGRYDVKAGRVLKIKKILDSKKAEGICRWNSRYLVSIDSDSPEMINEFYSFPHDVLD
ncbi:MAG: hypothetical protein B7Y39_08065 [Bdellovibrio sp. 28-41-41]|nr:MAG: hypothetical protein B7Y39_08065 [Bdellovibrio sp. 28-41-41]